MYTKQNHLITQTSHASLESQKFITDPPEKNQTGVVFIRFLIKQVPVYDCFCTKQVPVLEI